MIGDMQYVNEENFDEIIRELKKLAAGMGLKQVQFHCSPGIALHELFSRKYKPTASYPSLFQNFSSTIAPEKVKFTFADIDIF